MFDFGNGASSHNLLLCNKWTSTEAGEHQGVADQIEYVHSGFFG